MSRLRSKKLRIKLLSDTYTSNLKRGCFICKQQNALSLINIRNDGNISKEDTSKGDKCVTSDRRYYNFCSKILRCIKTASLTGGVVHLG